MTSAKDFADCYRLETEAPDIPDAVKTRWAILVDMLAESTGCPSALIMRAEPDRIFVDQSATTAETPYKPEASEALGSGLYCEEVMESGDLLHVPDALADPSWKDNPDVPLGMISYLGLPLRWPNGKQYGTVCVLDRSPIAAPNTVAGMLRLAREAVEVSLAAVWSGEGALTG